MAFNLETKPTKLKNAYKQKESKMDFFMASHTVLAVIFQRVYVEMPLLRNSFQQPGRSQRVWIFFKLVPGGSS